MHLTLDYWRPHQDSEGCKQDPDGLDSDLSGDNLGGEAEEYLGQINASPSKGDATEKVEPKTVRAAQRWFYDLQVLERLTRDKYPPLKSMHPTQISLARYVLVGAYKGGLGSGFTVPREVTDGMEDRPGRVHTRHEVWSE